MDTAVIVALVCVALVIVFVAWIRINSSLEGEHKQEDQRQSDETR